MKTPIDEQETIIRWYRDEKTADIYTSDTTMMTRYDKYVESGDWTLKENGTCQGDLVSKSYTAPKELLFGRSKKKRISEDVKNKYNESLALARSAVNNHRINSTP